MEEQHNSLSDMPEVLDARNIAAYLRIGYAKALHLIKYSDMPYIKIGNTYRINRRRFMQWLLEQNNNENAV